jgi:hypothetical protein
MTKRLLVSLPVLALLAACGSGERTWYNPFGWFGGSEEVATLVQDVGTPQDPRPLVDQVLAMSVEPFEGGAIIRATGLPPTQGFWAAELIPDPVQNGRANFRFVILPPPQPAPVSTQPSREVSVATALSNRELEGIREISVTGARNARSSRR